MAVHWTIKYSLMAVTNAVKEPSLKSQFSVRSRPSLKFAIYHLLTEHMTVKLELKMHVDIDI